MEENEHEEGDSDFVKSLLQTKEVLLEGRDILGSETEEPRNYNTISCWLRSSYTKRAFF